MTLPPGQLPQFALEDTPPEAYPGEIERPTFDAEIPEPPSGDTETPVPDTPAPSDGLRERWRTVARLYAHGRPRKQIAELTGYTPDGISKILARPWTKNEVYRYRQAYETDLVSRIKEAALDGTAVIHGIILDDTEKSTTRLDASKWAVEKTTGKPKQEVSVESGTLMQYMDMLKEMKTRGEVIDVTPAPSVDIGALQIGPADAVPDPWNAWLDANE